jgi:ribosomal protein S27AE
VINYWALTKDFSPGDSVQKFIPGHGDLSPYVGRVTAVHKGIGFVDVQWAFGNERVSPEDLLRVNPEFAKYLPPSLDFSWYPGYDVTRKKLAGGSPWRTDSIRPEVYKDMASLWNSGKNEVVAYDELWHKYASSVDDEILRLEVSRFYGFAKNATVLRIKSFAVRSAAYWVSQNRQYRVTQEEVGNRKPNCPKCGQQMRRTVYKMEEGARVKLFACPKCLYLIKRENLMGPGGLPVGW